MTVPSLALRARARAELNAAKAEEQQARLNLNLDLKQAFIRAQEAWERMEVTRKSLDTALEAQRIVQEQYEHGSADISILLQLQTGVKAIQTRNVAAKYDYLIALSNLQLEKGEMAE